MHSAGKLASTATGLPATADTLIGRTAAFVQVTVTFNDSPLQAKTKPNVSERKPPGGQKWNIDNQELTKTKTERPFGFPLPKMAKSNLAWDQPDNAFRVKKLGAGDWIRPQATGQEMAGALGTLMSPECHQRCRELAQNFQGLDALEKAAECIEAAHF